MAIVLPKRVAENIDRFAGRIWLLPRILEWWDRSEERLLLLTGGPGTGKSMILAWLSDFGPPPQDSSAQTQLTRLRSLVKAAHFCQASSRNVSPQAFAENIASQLTQSVKGFADALVATLQERVQITATQTIGSVVTGGSVTGISIGRLDLGTLSDELSFDRAFTQPLKKLYSSGNTKPILLLVDALDEALGYAGDRGLPALLATLGDLPPQVRVLITTRDDPRVLAYYSVTPFDLIKDAPQDTDDVRLYAIQRLESLNSIKEGKRIRFVQRLSKQSGGVFLYAAILLDELLEHSSAELPELGTYPLPKGLSGLYRNFLIRELGTEDKGRRWHQVYKPLLGFIAVAQGDGLTRKQLSGLLKLDLAEPLDACKQYLSGTLPDGPFSPFHKSFSDFLLEDKNNVRYHVDRREMHTRIAEHYLTKHRNRWAACDHYGLAHLPTHLGEISAFNELRKLFLDNSFVKSVSEFSSAALADSSVWMEKCTEGMSAGPVRRFLFDLRSAAVQLRHFIPRKQLTAAIESFLVGRDTQHLVIVGPPGTGKTTLLASIWVRHLDHCVLVTLRPGPRQGASSLAEVFAREAIPEIERISNNNSIDHHATIDSGYCPLFDAAERSGRPLCIIVDELDVFSTSEWASGLVLPSNPPRNLRFIWSSRPIPALGQFGSEAKFMNFEDARIDVQDMYRQRLAGKLSPVALERLIEKSEGLPLYLEPIAREIEVGRFDEEELLSNSPADLYEARIQKLENGSPLVQKQFNWLVHAMAEQKENEVLLWVGDERFDPDFFQVIEHSGLFAIDRTAQEIRIRPYHYSLLDFLRQRYKMNQ